MKRLKIYIAGPYTAQTEDRVWANVVAAMDAGIEVYKRGHIPFIPHLTHFVEERSQQTGAGLRWEDYLQWDRDWLRECDALLYLGSSRGADMERGWAEGIGLRIFHSLDEVPTVETPRSDDELTAPLLPRRQSA